jgi:hypothetical protein
LRFIEVMAQALGCEAIKKAGFNASFSNGLNRLIQAEPTPV